MKHREFKPGNMLYPLPAVMVSCQYPGSEDAACVNPALAGKPNIITVAWAGTVCTNPPMLSISVRPERYSYHMIKESGEFVVNLTTEALVRAADYCGVRSGRDVDKFAAMGLTPLPSQKVSVPGIAESPVHLECRVHSITPLGSHHMILADIVAVTVSEEFIDETGKFHLNDSGLVAYSHGEYFLLGKRLGSFGYSVAKKSGRSHASAGHRTKRGSGQPHTSAGHRTKRRSGRQTGSGT